MLSRSTKGICLFLLCHCLQIQCALASSTDSSSVVPPQPQQSATGAGFATDATCLVPFSVTVYSPIQFWNITPIDSSGGFVGVYAAQCPVGTVAYYPPGYSGPTNVNTFALQNTASCVVQGQGCQSTNAMMYQSGMSAAPPYLNGLMTVAYCAVPMPCGATGEVVLSPGAAFPIQKSLIPTGTPPKFPYYYVYLMGGGELYFNDYGLATITPMPGAAQNPVPGFNASQSDFVFYYTAFTGTEP